MDRLALYITDRRILNLLGQYMKRISECGGVFFEHECGISLGCPLSPLMGAFFLHELDEHMERTGLFYVRFMDDILVLAPTRWKLRRAIKALNAVLASLRLKKHPDKTTIGRIGRGFDFLGFHFGPDGLQVARQTLANFMKKASWLYEQERNGAGAPDALGMYVRRWLGWARAALSCAGKDGKRRSAGNAVLLTILGDVTLTFDGQNFLLPSSSPNDARINQFLPSRGERRLGGPNSRCRGSIGGLG